MNIGFLYLGMYLISLLIRPYFLDHGFMFGENNEINKDLIVKLPSLTSKSDLYMVNLTVKGPQRQKVKLAAKLFSQTVSAAI